MNQNKLKDMVGDGSRKACGQHTFLYLQCFVDL